MSLLLDVLYALALLLASPWIVYRLVRTRAWRTVPARLGFGIAPIAEGSVWLHGSSVGELSLLKPFVAAFEREFPDVPLVISSYTTTGLRAARSAYPGHRVMPFPLDFSFVAERMLKRLGARAIVVVESDFWPNFLSVALRREVPVAVVNGKLSEKSFRIHRRARWVAGLLRRFAFVAVQTEEHAERFRRLGVAPERVHVTGNMKYDLADNRLDGDERDRTRGALGFVPDDVVIIGGSLHAGEDEVLFRSFAGVRSACPAAALVVVPRYPEQAPEVCRHASEAGFAPELKTAVDSRARPAPGANGVLVVDTVGELGNLYAAADVAFVGGSLFYRGASKGGHNLMEPAVLGLPVLFGPYNFSFKETARDLVAAQAGVLVHDAAELERALTELASDRGRRMSFGERARQVVLRGQGATRRNLELLRPLVVRSRPVAAPVATDDNAVRSQ